MPRQARIDAPGALHHIIFRGIAQKKVFDDDADRDFFVDRLGLIIQETQIQCLAWALIPNHFHLLFKTGATPISTVMKRLLTGYAMHHNRRHKRYGHLFQNRYKSVLCQEDNYLLELIRYIHLNPLRAILVADMKGLGRYAYSGHSVLMGKVQADWQDTAYVAALFSDQLSLARRRYRAFVQKGIDIDVIAAKVAEFMGIDKNLIWSKGKQPKVVQARSLLCYWAASELGISQAALSIRLGLSPPAVSISVSRGRNLAIKKHLNIKLIK